MTLGDQHPELLQTLTDGISALTTSQRWEDYLIFQGRFHQYSYGNTLLIEAQAPEATQVAGYKAWLRMNRQVKRGEKAIWIVAPMVYRSKEEPTSDPQIKGFKWLPVFDIAQTSGEDLPAVCGRLQGDDPAGWFKRLASFAADLGFAVADHRFSGAVNGDCSHAEHLIRVHADNAEAMRVKTLIHELGHAMLHETVTDRALAELEAESVAFVVCAQLGIDSGQYSFGYLALWADGGQAAIAGVRASCLRIQSCANRILQALDSDDPDADQLGQPELAVGGLGRSERAVGGLGRPDPSAGGGAERAA